MKYDCLAWRQPDAEGFVELALVRDEHSIFARCRSGSGARSQSGERRVQFTCIPEIQRPREIAGIGDRFTKGCDRVLMNEEVLAAVHSVHWNTEATVGGSNFLEQSFAL